MLLYSNCILFITNYAISALSRIINVQLHEKCACRFLVPFPQTVTGNDKNVVIIAILYANYVVLCRIMYVNYVIWVCHAEKKGELSHPFLHLQKEFLWYSLNQFSNS